MAYQSHGRNPGREPLLDQNMQAALERRGRELIGLVLVGLGLLAAMAIGSYSPDDPNWMVATDAPVQNWLGRAGATMAAPLFMIVGWGAFGIGILLMAWGVRFGLNIGRERAFSRLIFAPIAIALASVYAATLAPPVGWSHSFGLGGLFGDTVLLMILQIVPGTAALGAKLISLLAGLMILTFWAFVLGFTWAEIYRLTRWMVLGLVLIYAFVMKALGRGASLGAAATRKAADVSRNAADAYAAKKAARREEEAANEELWAQQMHNVGRDDAEERQRVAQVIRANLAAEQGLEPAPAPAPFVPLEEEPKAGLRALMPAFAKKDTPREMPEPELVAPAPLTGDVPETSEDRLRSKIAKAIRTRGKTEPIGPAPIGPVVGAAGLAAAAPMVASAAPFMRPEPQLTRDVAAPAPAPMPAPIPQPMPAEETYAEVSQAQAAPVLDAPSPLLDSQEDDGMASVSYAEDTVLEPAPPIVAPEPPKSLVQHMPKKPVRPSTRAMAEAQPKLSFVDERPDYEHPPLSLLMNPDQVERHHLSDEALEENARMLESVLDDYGVKGEIVSVRPGPVVTMYELEPAPGLKASRVIGLADDIARSMSALSARVSTVPGRSVIGIELPNEKREMVALREILSGRDFGDTTMRLPLALGKDIGGDPIVANLAKMPHLLIAGTTGSGKSVAINTMILSLLYRLTPEECRLIMIDPKMLELSVYDGIPHLLSPVVTDPKKAVVALKWVVGEMEERYRKMSKMGVRNIEGFNSRVADALSKDEMFTRTVQTGFDEDTGEPVFETEEIQPEKLPYIVVIVDEMADL
ncbi:MAG: DNA translocase FtsK 4TM domain-containing protein, partial [Pseudomonadota bacterium]